MKKEQQTLYVSPQVKTVEIKAQAIICLSNNPPLSGGNYNDPFGWGEDI